MSTKNTHAQAMQRRSVEARKRDPEKLREQMLRLVEAKRAKRALSAATVLPDDKNASWGRFLANARHIRFTIKPRKR